MSGDGAGSGDGADAGFATTRGSADPTWRAAAREDLAACVDVRLHLVLSGIFVLALGAAGVSMAALSEAFYTSGDLPGTIELLTANAAWLFTSLVALVGLFVGYPAAVGSRRRTAAAAGRTASPDRFLGRLVARGALVGASVLAGLVALLLVALVAYEPFSPVAFLAFALATVALAVAYVSVGVAISAIARTAHRAIAGLLAVYVLLALLWDTWIVPLGILLVSAGGNPDVLAARPAWFDGLVAASPAGAYGALGGTIVGGPLDAVAAAALVSSLAWTVGPAVVGYAVVRRRTDDPRAATATDGG